jgi:hypothetical protein
MNNPGLKEEIWTDLRQKWAGLVDEGHTVKVEFNILKDPKDENRDLAIDVAQYIDGEWVVQTVQRQAREAYAVIGIEGLMLDQLINLAGHVVDSITEPITSRETYDDEMHLFMKHISPETSEIYGYVISETGEKIGVRPNYQHYYVINEILEQISKIMKEKYREIQLHRSKEDYGGLYFRFVPA